MRSAVLGCGVLHTLLMACGFLTQQRVSCYLLHWFVVESPTNLSHTIRFHRYTEGFGALRRSTEGCGERHWVAVGGASTCNGGVDSKAQPSMTRVLMLCAQGKLLRSHHAGTVGLFAGKDGCIAHKSLQGLSFHASQSAKWSRRAVLILIWNFSSHHERSPKAVTFTHK